MKITFKGEHYDYSLYGQQSKEPISTITYVTEHDTLDSILEEFTNFLRGCGYMIDGYLDVVPHEEIEHEWHNEEFLTPTDENTK